MFRRHRAVSLAAALTVCLTVLNAPAPSQEPRGNANSQLGYGYQGPSQWSLDAPGENGMARNATATPGGPFSRTTSGTGWRAPVSPAMGYGATVSGRGGPAFGGSPMSPTRSQAASLVEQAAIDANALATRQQAQAIARQEPPIDEQVAESLSTCASAVYDQAASGLRSVKGAYNWLKLETRDMVESRTGKREGVMSRPKREDCGQRRFRWWRGQS